MSLSLVCDLSDVARVTVHVVSHSLQAAVGELYGVGALGVVVLAVFLVVEVVACVAVVHLPVEGVLRGIHLFGRLLVCREEEEERKMQLFHRFKAQEADQGKRNLAETKYNKYKGQRGLITFRNPLASRTK